MKVATGGFRIGHPSYTGNNAMVAVISRKTASRVLRDRGASSEEIERALTAAESGSCTHANGVEVIALCTDAEANRYGAFAQRASDYRCIA